MFQSLVTWDELHWKIAGAVVQCEPTFRWNVTTKSLIINLCFRVRFGSV